MAADEDRREAPIEAVSASRYRRAADDTLEQLEWCINYLHRIRKPKIADALDANRRAIKQRMAQPRD